MTTPDQVREFALALPEAYEQVHFDKPSFRVNKKIFGTLWTDEARTVLKLSLEDQSALLQAYPDTFSLCGWEHQGWISVDLKKIKPEMFKLHVESAWRQVAPKKLIRAFEEKS